MRYAVPFTVLQGKYCIATDPLDGSSNIDCNVSTGTIFGIYKRHENVAASVASILRPGRELVCAGYCMYGSSTQLVFTAGNGVHGFTLDPVGIRSFIQMCSPRFISRFCS